MPCRLRDLIHAALCALALSCAQSPHRSAESRIYAAGLEAIGLDCESTDRVMVTTLPSTQAMLMSPGEFQEQLMLGLPDGSLTSEIAAHMIADMAALVEAQRGRQAWNNAGRNPVRRLMASFQLICHAVHEPVLVKVSPVASFADFAMFECSVPLHLRKPDDRTGIRFVVLQREPTEGGYALRSPKDFLPVISTGGRAEGIVLLLFGLRQIFAGEDIGYL